MVPSGKTPGYSLENSPAIFMCGGEPWVMRYCWPTPKGRNLSIQDAVFEGKKADETSPRKSTPRTLKEVGQQYPPVICTACQGRRVAGKPHTETQYNNQCPD